MLNLSGNLVSFQRLKFEKTRNLEIKTADFKCYALVIDENTDATNKVHFAIFIRGIDSEYNVIEEMPSLVPLKDRSKPLNLYEAVGITLK